MAEPLADLLGLVFAAGLFYGGWKLLQFGASLVGSLLGLFDDDTDQTATDGPQPVQRQRTRQRQRQDQRQRQRRQATTDGGTDTEDDGGPTNDFDTDISSLKTYDR